MSVWFVLLIFGKVAVSVGPLPVSEDACWDYAREQEEQIDAAYASPAQKPFLDGKLVRRIDMAAVCRVQDERPALDDFKVGPEQ